MHRDCPKLSTLALATPLDFKCGRHGECAEVEADQVVQRGGKGKERLEQDDEMLTNSDNEDTPKNTHTRNSPSATFEETTDVVMIS